MAHVKALDSDRYEMVIGSSVRLDLTPQLHPEPADITRQLELEIEDKRRLEVIRAAKKEYADNRAVIDERFPGTTFARWIDSALQGEHLPTLSDVERIAWGG